MKKKMKLKLGVRIRFAIWNIIVRALMRISYTMLIAEKRKLPIYADRGLLFSVYINEIVKHMYWLCKISPQYIYVTIASRTGKIYPSVWPATMRIDPKVEKSLALQTINMVYKGSLKFKEEMAQRN